MSKRSEAKRKPCTECTKQTLRKTWYYRNNSYFCGKDCFTKFMEKKVGKGAKQEATV
jgi:hypothetical protein